MTVNYIQYVHTAGNFGPKYRLLAVWRGSIMKGVGIPLIIYIVLYTSITLIYRLVLPHYEDLKRYFELLCVFCFKYENYLPLDFILGFYVTQVIGRWWLQFQKVWWADNLAMDLAAYLPGPGYNRLVRREMVRLANLSSVMAYRRLCAGTAKRFPTLQHFVTAGLMTDNELILAEKMDKNVASKHQITWLPICWAQAKLARARKKCRALDSYLYQTLHKDLQDVADRNSTLISYNWVSIPLMYTQLVTLAVHIYFASTLFASQYLSPTMYLKENGTYSRVPSRTADAVNFVAYDNTLEDFYVPIFTLIRFVFYFAWLHVAEVLINPFGEDDEDFDVNYLIDRNVQVSFLMVDGCDELEDIEDPYHGHIPVALPHTKKSIKTVDPHPGNMTDGIIENLSEFDMKLTEEDELLAMKPHPSLENLYLEGEDQELDHLLPSRAGTSSSSTSDPVPVPTGTTPRVRFTEMS